jgi:hypothetical protein
MPPHLLAPGPRSLSKSPRRCSSGVVAVLTCGLLPRADTDGHPRTVLNETATECHEAGGLPPGARLLVLGRQNVSEGGRLSWCTLGWT